MPIFISPDTGRFTTNEIRLGSRGDSYYEYLIKRWLMGGCEDDKCGGEKDIPCTDTVL